MTLRADAFAKLSNTMIFSMPIPHTRFVNYLLGMNMPWIRISLTFNRRWRVTKEVSQRRKGDGTFDTSSQ